MNIEIIEIGEYVRTKRDGICKLLYKANDAYGRFCGHTGRGFFLREEDIVNHSKNIIDLLETGDVAKINAYGFIIFKQLDEGDILSFKVDGWELIEVLTKEQFEVNCFKVEE